jgi:hypothetical protein
MHLGEARYVNLSGLTNKTGVFRAISKSLGLPFGDGNTTTEMQGQIVNFLHRTKILCVFDEAHHLFSGGARIYARPELIDWLDTDFFNHGVPFALICTNQFRLRMIQVEKQVGWSSGQFKRRMERYITLPDALQPSDLKAVARKLLPAANKEMVDFLVGYAGPNKQPMDSLVKTVREARSIAEGEGRREVAYKDLRRAIDTYRNPSDAALATPFDLPRKAGLHARRGLVQAREQPSGSEAARPLQTGFNRVAGRVQGQRRAVDPDAEQESDFSSRDIVDRPASAPALKRAKCN